MHSHLKTFNSTLTAHSKVIARKLNKLNTYENILLKVSLALSYLIAK